MLESDARGGSWFPESPVPDALVRLLALLGRRIGAESMDRVWIFPPLVRGRKEWGLVAVSCLIDDPVQRDVITGRYAAELTGTGVLFEPTIVSEGTAPRDRLGPVMDGVVRRSDLQLGSPRQVEIRGNAEAFLRLLRELGGEIEDGGAEVR